MLPWLIPVAFFWTLAAMYLGGAAIDFHGGGAVRHLGALILHFAGYLVLYGVLRLVLGGLGPVLGGVVFPFVIASILLPFVGKLAFRIFGVRITSSSHAGGEAHA
jgi:hypothetical protein